MKQCPQCSTGYPDSLAACPTHGLPLNEIRDLKPGMVVHHSYRIVRKLGQGGMGSVYLAQHTLMDEPRALKFLSSELSSDQAFTSRFLREVRVLRQIRNRNVVDCGDLERAEDDSLFFSMEFVDGPDLRRFLHTAPHPFDVPLALAITRGIAEGLGAAHSKSMVHRDIKPENILMAREGGAWLPKIADFGIVATKESSDVFTRTGGTLLTMTYAAPEQWRGTPAAQLDGRTDLYALGGLLYEMLTGQTPFQAESYEGWAHQHQTTPPEPPSAIRPDLANWQGLDALVLRLLAKDRNDRPKDVAELLGLLDTVRCFSRKAFQGTVSEKGDLFIRKRFRSIVIWGLVVSITLILAMIFVGIRAYTPWLRVKRDNPFADYQKPIEQSKLKQNQTSDQSDSPNVNYDALAREYARKLKPKIIIAEDSKPSIPKPEPAQQLIPATVDDSNPASLKPKISQELTRTYMFTYSMLGKNIDSAEMKTWLSSLGTPEINRYSDRRIQQRSATGWLEYNCSQKTWCGVL